MSLGPDTPLASIGIPEIPRIHPVWPQHFFNQLRRGPVLALELAHNPAQRHPADVNNIAPSALNPMERLEGLSPKIVFTPPPFDYHPHHVFAAEIAAILTDAAERPAHRRGLSHTPKFDLGLMRGPF